MSLFKKHYLYLFFGGLFCLTIFWSVNFAMEKKMTIKNNPMLSRSLNLLQDEFTIGKDYAPIKMVFYGDFSCVHCKRFVKDNFKKLYENYLVSGKVQLIFRPVIKTKATLSGSKFLFCEKRDDELNYRIFMTMFNTNWNFNQDYLNALLRVLKENNFTTPQHFAECESSKELQNNLRILYQKTTEMANINTTPRVFLNKISINANATIFAEIDKMLIKLKNQNKTN